MICICIKGEFFSDFWHNLILIFPFLGGLLFDEIAIYDKYNNRNWDDFWFVLEKMVKFMVNLLLLIFLKFKVAIETFCTSSVCIQKRIVLLEG